MPPKIPRFIICTILFVGLFEILLVLNIKLKLFNISRQNTMYIAFGAFLFLFFSICGLGVYWALKMSKIRK